MPCINQPKLHDFIFLVNIKYLRILHGIMMIRLDISNTYIYISLFNKFIIRNNVCHRLSTKNAENRVIIFLKGKVDI